MSDATFERHARNDVKRLPSRGQYERETIYQILDDGFLCHVGFSTDNQPFVIPVAYGRKDDTIYLHGSIKSRLMQLGQANTPLCITVTHVDGLVLARSAFHSSLNYRSVVLFGQAEEVTDSEEKTDALHRITNQILRGRWEEVRELKASEIMATSVLKMRIEDASAKIRTGGPKDDKEDYALPIWAGVVPMHTQYGAPEPDPLRQGDYALPESVENLMKS
ncbi:MAG: pyridoxamine 5'-phosphate oxidase family protein [Haliscomenobacter sp.]